MKLEDWAKIMASAEKVQNDALAQKLYSDNEFFRDMRWDGSKPTLRERMAGRIKAYRRRLALFIDPSLESDPWC
jgi:hypothetical protein